MVKDIKIEDFYYDLPEEKIAKYPTANRDKCKLLLKTPSGKIFHRIFKELPGLLPLNSMLVCNETKVIKARLFFHKDSGASIEIFLLEPLNPVDYQLNFQSRESCEWKCLVGNLKKWKEGELTLEIPSDNNDSICLHARKKETLQEGGVAIEFHWTYPDITFSEIIDRAGKIPIPPYLNRESESRDTQDYQTIFAREEGSVAAPTAGLHFTPEVFEDLTAHNVKITKLTLHVGAGTFRPVKSETIGNHEMHSERFSVSLQFLCDLYEWKKKGKPVIAVGTTSVRTLESIPYIAEAYKRGLNHADELDQWRAYSEEYGDFDTLESLRFLIEKLREEGKKEITASTSIMIAPGFRWRIVDGMVTNFHQPKSTLLLLVSSFLDGKEEWRGIYDEALTHGYRFLSYGDACLFLNGSCSVRPSQSNDKL